MKPSRRPSRHTLLVLLLVGAILCPAACDRLSTGSLSGHRDIAAALRPLLDLGYAEPDYATYHTAFVSFQGVVEKKLATTPYAMRPFVQRIVAYLQVADEVLAWRDRSTQLSQTDDSPIPTQLDAWTARYPFLKAALGARLEQPDIFDATIAAQMLFEKTEQTLVAMQLKNKPI